MRSALIVLIAFFIVAAFALISSNATAEDPPKERPRVAMCSPLFVASKATSKVVIRGWKIEPATAVACDSPHITINILSKGPAAVPNKQDAKQIGDQQVEIEVTVGDMQESATAVLTVVAPDGTSEPHTLLIGSSQSMTADQEPNDGFRHAQVVQLPQTIDGLIHADGNVDVFAFDLDQPNQVTVEVNARKLGSGLDGILTLYDSRYNILADNDDHADSPDPYLTATLKAGRYFVVLQDAHDHGGPAHPYRLNAATCTLSHGIESCHRDVSKSSVFFPPCKLTFATPNFLND
jgi:hypothetical protein